MRRTSLTRIGRSSNQREQTGFLSKSPPSVQVLAIIVALVLTGGLIVTNSIGLFRNPAPQFVGRGLYVVDKTRNIEWMRCTVGQRWSGAGCTGRIMALSHSEASEAITMASRQLGSGWRLPDHQELKSLLCAKCGPPQIDPLFFPDTGKRPYWSSQKVFISPRNFWSVNFLTGHSYTGFFPDQALAIRLVRDLH